MQELWKILSSPRHIMVFEAAARLGSFTHAALELHIQQPAVSATIKQLENSLGVQLFNRQHRQITLTAAGKKLFTDTTKVCDLLLGSVRSIQQHVRRDYVTLNASSAFNFYWMMPRLANFQKMHPQIDLRLQASDREPNIDVENISLAVRRGRGDWSNCEAELIAMEEIYPVAAPNVLATATKLKNLPNLLDERLIHLEEPIRERPTWREWFQNFDIRVDSLHNGLRLNDYALVLQAAMAGQGFAFGWRHLTDPLVANGILAAKREWTWNTGLGFYIVWSKNKPLSPASIVVRDWILENR